MGQVGRIAICLVLGIIVAMLFPQASVIGVLGDLFVGALKAVAPLLVFFLVMSSIAKHKSGQEIYVKNIVIFYAISTLASAALAVVVSFIYPISINLAGIGKAGDEAPKAIGDVLQNVLLEIVTNPVTAISTGLYLSILFWSILTGLALKKASQQLVHIVDELSNVAKLLIHWIVLAAPIGIFGLVYKSVTASGFNGLLQYGQLILVLVITMLAVAFGINAIFVAILIRHNPYPLIWYTIKNSAIYAFFTRSSAANIPNNIKAAENLKLNPESYNISLPLGATINMSGAAVVITIMTLSAVHTLGISIDIGSAILLSIVASLSAAGVSGVAGGSLLLIPLSCNLFGISSDIAMQVVAVGFIIGIIQDSTETALNSSSDLLYTIASEFNYRIKKGEKINFKQILK